MVKRTPVKISTEEVNLTKALGDVNKDARKKKSVKESGAWRYPNGVIQRAPTVKLGNNHYYDDRDKDQPRRKHESNFFITLNTNRKVGESVMEGRYAQYGKDAAAAALEQLSSTKYMCQYMKFGPKSDHYRNDVFDEVIFKVDWQGAVEVGDALERLHCHVWLTVHHYSQVQINMPVLQRMFKALYNAHVTPIGTVGGINELKVNRMPYIQVKLLPSSDWAMVIRQYIHKAMVAP